MYENLKNRLKKLEEKANVGKEHYHIFKGDSDTDFDKLHDEYCKENGLDPEELFALDVVYVDPMINPIIRREMEKEKGH